MILKINPSVYCIEYSERNSLNSPITSSTGGGGIWGFFARYLLNLIANPTL